MTNILSEICLKKREYVDSKISSQPLEDIKAALQDVSPPLAFINTLQSQTEVPALIAEVKKASPSKGIIREDFDHRVIAQIYEKAGASCLSVLTDEPYFQGHNNFLKDIKGESSLPLLRKDFMIDTYQIYESRALGADCILLIMAALSDDLYKELYELSQELGMDILVEVHNQEELERAIKLNPKMLGVNNRNLKTLAVDIQTSKELVQYIPSECVKVAESGISNHDTIASLQESGFDAFLVGESLMREDNIRHATQKLLGIAEHI